MHPEAAGPAAHYYMVRGGTEQKNITIWESGTVGGEFIKAYGHYHVDELGEVYDVLFGEGVFLIQERAKDAEGHFIDDELDSIRAIFVKAGSRVEVPPHAGHAMVNTGSTWLVTSDDSPVAPAAGENSGWPLHADYEPVKRARGFGYYVVEEGGETKFVKNPAYRVVPELTISNA